MMFYKQFWPKNKESKERMDTWHDGSVHIPPTSHISRGGIYSDQLQKKAFNVKMRQKWEFQRLKRRIEEVCELLSD